MAEKKYTKKNKIKKLNIALFFILFVLSYILIFLIDKIAFFPLIDKIDINKNEISKNNVYEDTITNSNDINKNNGSEMQNNIISNSLLNNNFSSSNNNEILENPEPVVIKVLQNGKEWTQLASLDIFSNPYSSDNNVIAPGMKHRYNFDIQNESNKKIIYFIKFKEENNKQINLMYRLKKNNEYIFGNDDEWIYIDNKTTNNYILTGKSKENYELEWFWKDSDRDTAIGQDKDASYRINIEVNSVVVEE